MKVWWPVLTDSDYCDCIDEYQSFCLFKVAVVVTLLWQIAVTVTVTVTGQVSVTVTSQVAVTVTLS